MSRFFGLFFFFLVKALKKKEKWNQLKNTISISFDAANLRRTARVRGRRQFSIGRLHLMDGASIYSHSSQLYPVRILFYKAQHFSSYFWLNSRRVTEKKDPRGSPSPFLCEYGGSVCHWFIGPSLFLPCSVGHLTVFDNWSIQAKRKNNNNKNCEWSLTSNV